MEFIIEILFGSCKVRSATVIVKSLNCVVKRKWTEVQCLHLLPEARSFFFACDIEEKVWKDEYIVSYCNSCPDRFVTCH